MEEKRKVGKPPWIPTQETIEEVERLAARGLTQQQIADSLGIHISTLCEKKNEYEEFAEAIRRGQGKGIAKVANALFNNAIDNENVAAQIFYLKNRAKWREEDLSEKIDSLKDDVKKAVDEAISKHEQPR